MLAFSIFLFLSGVVRDVKINTVEAEQAVKKTHLNHVDRNTVKTIKTEDGDTFDCVDIYKQPAFSHPLLKDHKLQMNPRSYPKENHHHHENTENESNFDEKCPEGTVPVHRLPSTPSYSSQHQGSSRNSILQFIPFFHPPIYKKYVAEVRKKDSITYGASANLNVYAVPNVGPEQVSSSRIQVMNPAVGAYLAGGWTVNPKIFNDTNTRLFVMWSGDTDGLFEECYNMLCPGFVQTNSNVGLGMILKPVSVLNGQQIAFKIYIFRDDQDGNWWLAFKTPSNVIGYWPGKLFKNFANASEVRYGGYTSCRSGETCPAMGNGQLPSQKNDRSCFFVEVQYFDVHKNLLHVSEEDHIPFANQSDCYDVGRYAHYGGGGESFGFGFGGPSCKKS